MINDCWLFQKIDKPALRRFVSIKNTIVTLLYNTHVIKYKTMRTEYLYMLSSRL